MDSQLNPIIVIPAYNPDGQQLISLVKDLLTSNNDIIIVNDGSKQECANTFTTLTTLQGVTVLHHKTNQGKGAALKTAFLHFLATNKSSCGVVTCDADGQHLPKDIKNIASKLITQKEGRKEGRKEGSLILGYRHFDDDIPLRSKFGNKLTQSICSFLLGTTIYDTQTGLRGIPRDILNKLLTIEYNRYEYEMAMLVECAPKIEQYPIETVYLNGNASSHFNPIKDSILIYSVLLKHISNSLLSAVLDYAVFSVLLFCTCSILLSLLCARTISATFNFFVGKNYVYKSNGNTICEIVKYITLVILVFIADYIGVILLSWIGISAYIGKIIVETIVFICCYYIQKSFVFRG